MYVMTDAYDSLRFSAIFSASLLLTVAFWCHPSSCCEDKGIEWKLIYVNHSFSLWLYLSFYFSCCW